MIDYLRSTVTEEHLERTRQFDGGRIMLVTGSLPTTQEIYRSGGIDLCTDRALALFAGRGEDHYGRTSGVGPIVNSYRAHNHTTEAAGAKALGIKLGVEAYRDALQVDIDGLSLGARDTAHLFISPDGSIRTVLNKTDKGQPDQVAAHAQQIFIMAERGDHAGIKTTWAILSPDRERIRLLATEVRYGVVAPQTTYNDLLRYMIEHGTGIAGSIDWLDAVRLGVITPYNEAYFVHQQLAVGTGSADTLPQDLWKWMRVPPQARKPLWVVDEVRGELPFTPGESENLRALLLLSRGILVQ
jgi:hypothetical protein